MSLAADFYSQGLKVPWRKSLGVTLQNGNGTIEYTDPSHIYIIEQVAIQVDGGTNGSCIVEIGNDFICGTNSGSLDSADGTPPIVLHPGETLRISWVGVANGTEAHATLIGMAVTYQ